MRIWFVIGIAVAGLAVGLGATVAELGFAPSGGSRIEFGSNPGPQAPTFVNPPGKVPKAVVVGKELEFNFGKAEKESAKRHDFVIRNEGNGILTLTKGATSCVCTVSAIAREELPPGESTKVTLGWHAKSPRSVSSKRRRADERSQCADGRILCRRRVRLERAHRPGRISLNGLSFESRWCARREFSRMRRTISRCRIRNFRIARRRGFSMSS